MAAKSITDDEIIAAVRAVHGSLAAAARELKISPRTLSRRLALMKPIHQPVDDLALVMAKYQQSLMAAAMAGNTQALIKCCMYNGLLKYPRLRLKDEP